MKTRKVWSLWKERGGQALVAVSLLIAIVITAIGITTDVGELIIRNIKLQNAADAGAYRGAETLALALNAVALGNAAIDVLGIAAIFTYGETFRAIRAVQIAQDEVIKAAPAVSVATGIMVSSTLNEADMAVPLNRLNSNELLPSLMVRRMYLFPSLLGYSIPLWIADSYTTTRQKPYGDRFLRLGVIRSGDKTTFIGKLLRKNLSIPTSYAFAEPMCQEVTCCFQFHHGHMRHGLPRFQ